MEARGRPLRRSTALLALLLVPPLVLGWLRAGRLETRLEATEAEHASVAEEHTRLQAENRHLREAYNQLSEHAAGRGMAVSTRANLRRSLDAAREMIGLLQEQNNRLADELARLRDDR